MTPLRRIDRLVMAPSCAAREALECVPDKPGYYAIFVDSPFVLPKIFAARVPRSGLIYIGISERSTLLNRLVRQDLRHETPASFFRSLGAVLGFKPIRGSLFGKKNQQNYTFSVTDTQEIIEWIDRYLSVNWLRSKPSKAEEKRLIKLHEPVFNIQHNPHKCEQLEDLRRRCRETACQPPIKRIEPALGDKVPKAKRGRPPLSDGVRSQNAVQRNRHR